MTSNTPEEPKTKHRRNHNKIEYIFIFSPYNSGKTALSQYLASNIKNCYLPQNRNHEGLKIDEVWSSIDTKNRWDATKPLNYTKAIDIWPALALQNKCSIFLEASPPNLCHTKQALEIFNPRYSLFHISNPYLFIGSCINRYGRRFEITEFNESLDLFASRWKELSSIQMQNCLDHPSIPLLSYETFCKNPSSSLSLLRIERNKLKKTVQSIEGKHTTKVREIIDMTPKYLSFLRMQGIERIKDHLLPHKKVLDFFGYSILNIDKANEMMRENPALTNESIYDRIHWNDIKVPLFLNNKKSST